MNSGAGKKRLRGRKGLFLFQSNRLIADLTDAEQAFAHFGVNGGG